MIATTKIYTELWCKWFENMLLYQCIYVIHPLSFYIAITSKICLPNCDSTWWKSVCTQRTNILQGWMLLHPACVACHVPAPWFSAVMDHSAYSFCTGLHVSDWDGWCPHTNSTKPCLNPACLSKEAASLAITLASTHTKPSLSAKVFQWSILSGILEIQYNTDSFVHFVVFNIFRSLMEE